MDKRFPATPEFLELSTDWVSRSFASEEFWAAHDRPEARSRGRLVFWPDLGTQGS